MWIFNFLPYWVFYFLIIVGVAGLLAAAVLKFLPLVSTYRLPIQVVSGALLLVGVYFQGAVSNQETWEAKIKDLQAKIAVAEEKSKQVNTVIEYKYIDRVKVVKDTQVIVEEKIKEVAKVIDKVCEVSPEAITILNTAAKKPEAAAVQDINAAAKKPTGTK